MQWIENTCHLLEVCAYSRVWAEWIAKTDTEKGLKDHQSRILATFSYLLNLKKTGICDSTVQRNMAALSFLFKIFIPNICRDQYETVLLKTAFSLAFFEALRIGELVSPSRTKPGGLNIRDIKILGQSVSLNIRFSKTDKSIKGKHILLTTIRGNCCPVRLTKQYLNIRRDNQGQFLIHEDGSFVFPLPIFRACLKANSISPEIFCTHSFRIGATTEAGQLGFPEERIKRIG
ncbi:hypothetical protein XELAEV_18037329mg [Xenopus laevis]|uniref:Tyr recombinase domain-containing protein n=1 Tax=Xenopus laevis TaxID=8355 RepID=A0A974CD69_XENLA|nr:hypothetical protein XELAEV_18037329mg [Xenopus laevis]